MDKFNKAKKAALDKALDDLNKCIASGDILGAVMTQARIKAIAASSQKKPSGELLEIKITTP